MLTKKYIKFMRKWGLSPKGKYSNWKDEDWTFQNKAAITGILLVIGFLVITDKVRTSDYKQINKEFKALEQNQETLAKAINEFNKAYAGLPEAFNNHTHRYSDGKVR